MSSEVLVHSHETFFFVSSSTTVTVSPVNECKYTVHLMARQSQESIHPFLSASCVLIIIFKTISEDDMINFGDFSLVLFFFLFHVITSLASCSVLSKESPFCVLCSVHHSFLMLQIVQLNPLSS